MSRRAEVDRLVENLDRLRTHVESVRALSTTARDDLASVLHTIVGDGRGYQLAERAFSELHVDLPEVAMWGKGIAAQKDEFTVELGLRGSPAEAHLTGPLLEHLDETCLRFAVPGVQPEANWSYRDLIKKVRNNFGSHADGSPPQWLTDLRVYPAGDSDAVTFLLWRAGEVTLRALTAALNTASVDIDMYEPEDDYLDGIHLIEAAIMVSPDLTTVDMHMRPASWKGRHPAIIGGQCSQGPVLAGLNSAGHPTLAQGEPGSSVEDLLERHRRQGLPKPGRNEPCWCGSGLKSKRCNHA